MATESTSLQQKAYDVLNKYFSEHEDEVLNVEMLPPAFPPPDGICMQEELNLGLPREILASAFIEARRIFLRHMRGDPLYDLTYQSTRLILLFNPEYLTAANFRKRRLLHLQSLTSKSDPSDNNSYTRALNRELIFLASILTSPLHRQTKSPTLWHHRYWVVKHHLLPNLPQAKIPDFLRSELSIVCKSGERHPKNYYAFQYARRIFNLFHDDECSYTGLPNAPFPADAIDTLRSWCCRHPSDISGFSFLAWLLQRYEDLDVQRRVVGRIVDYAVNLQIGNESLWVFVRTMLAEGTMGQARMELLKVLMGYLENSDAHSENEEDSVHEKARQILDWIERYGESVADPVA